DEAGVRALLQRERQVRRGARGHDCIRHRLVVHGQEEQTRVGGRDDEAPVHEAGVGRHVTPLTRPIHIAFGARRSSGATRVAAIAIMATPKAIMPAVIETKSCGWMVRRIATPIESVASAGTAIASPSA